MPLALSIEKNNFPISMAHYFLCQAREYARIATEAPLKKNPKYEGIFYQGKFCWVLTVIQLWFRAPPFQPKVHLREVIEFLIKKCVKRYPTETCPLCNKCPLPSDPSVSKFILSLYLSSFSVDKYCVLFSTLSHLHIYSNRDDDLQIYQGLFLSTNGNTLLKTGGCERWQRRQLRRESLLRTHISSRMLKYIYEETTVWK